MLKYSSSKDKVKAIRQLVHTLCLYYFDNVTDRELDLLCEIIAVGRVCKEAKDSFMINYQTSKENTAQILNRLTNKKIIIPREYRTGKDIHPYFHDIKDIVEGKKDKFILIEYDVTS